ncbi:MAG: pyruvate kinase [Candidatus Omnitrophica bacterium]|nr:pyruvate kinase [Candidatus Omnitrophota bacterium]MCM8827179.1 pyruvate kinase [Candidatus Omnitrophota bacterium]
MVKTKIIATLGPASNKETVLRKMFICGLDVVRLNFSHGTHNEHIKNIELVRYLNKKMRRKIKIMQDLEGYRLRIGKLEKEIELKKNMVFYLTTDRIVGNEKEVPFDYNDSLKMIKQGSLIYIDDGRILLRVIDKDKRRLKVKVIIPAPLKERKGINILGVNLSFKALTEKDRRDLEVAINYRLEYVAQSFVRDRQDIRSLREVINGRNLQCKIFAKIENQQALKNIDSIIEEADGIIVARGDLGICLPIYKIPILQKEIIKRCRVRGKPVVVATQMLESMVNDSLPTRAEVSDVANAIIDGADFLLLSAETAIGRHPPRVVEMMNRIIKYTEDYLKRLEEILL